MFFFEAGNPSQQLSVYCYKSVPDKVSGKNQKVGPFLVESLFEPIPSCYVRVDENSHCKSTLAYRVIVSAGSSVKITRDNLTAPTERKGQGQEGPDRDREGRGEDAVLSRNGRRRPNLPPQEPERSTMASPPKTSKKPLTSRSQSITILLQEPSRIPRPNPLRP